MKICITCKEEKKDRDFDLRRRGATMRRSECKKCEWNRKLKRRNGEIAPKSKPEPTGVSKTCTHCGEEKDTSLFDKDMLGRHNVASRCKICRARLNAEYIKKKGDGKCEKAILLETPLS